MLPHVGIRHYHSLDAPACASGSGWREYRQAVGVVIDVGSAGGSSRWRFVLAVPAGSRLSGTFAVPGLSRPRPHKTFEGLRLDEQLKAKRAEARWGLQVIDRPGGVIHLTR